MLNEEYITKILVVTPDRLMKEVPFGSTSKYIFMNEDGRNLEETVGDMSKLLNTNGFFFTPPYKSKTNLVNAINYLYSITR